MELIEFKYGTFWPRFWAGWIDALLFLPLVFLNEVIWNSSSTLPLILLLAWHIAFSISMVAYYVLMHGRFGQTLGKMVMKVKVLDILETKLSYRQAIMRDIVPIVSVLITLPLDLPDVLQGINPTKSENLTLFTKILLSIHAIWFLLELTTMLANNGRRALHDFIASSVVARTPNKVLYQVG